MKLNKLGRTNIEVSEISFGGAVLSGEAGGYSFGKMNDKDAQELVELALHHGINHFDTAPIYGFGASERRLGAALKTCREKIYLTSKSGITWHENQRVDLNNSPEVTIKMLEQSLRDLQTEYIDFYYIHWPDPRVDIRRPVEVLMKAKEQGKLKYIGLSNTNPLEYQSASEVGVIDIIQGQYNYLHPDLDPMKEIIQRDNLGAMSWGSYHKGVLTGVVGKKREYDSSDGRSGSPWWKKSEINQEIDDFEPLMKKLIEKNIDLRSFALASIFYQDYITSALVGMRTPEYLKQTLDAVESLPSRELFFELTGK